MSAIETIKTMGLICDDVANYVLLDFIVGDKPYWKKNFNKCIDVIQRQYKKWYNSSMCQRYLIIIMKYETKNHDCGGHMGHRLFVKIKQR